MPKEHWGRDRHIYYDDCCLKLTPNFFLFSCHFMYRELNNVYWRDLEGLWAQFDTSCTDLIETHLMATYMHIHVHVRHIHVVTHWLQPKLLLSCFYIKLQKVYTGLHAIIIMSEVTTHLSFSLEPSLPTPAFFGLSDTAVDFKLTDAVQGVGKASVFGLERVLEISESRSWSALSISSK